MEDASLLLWQAIEAKARERGAGDASYLLAICGSGNNGGDALALLRHARFSGLKRIAAILAKEPTGLAAMQVASLKALGVEILSWPDDRAACAGRLAQASLVIDGLSGTGLSGPLREPQLSLLAAAAAVRASGAAIASIDLPSGLSDSYEEGWPIALAEWTLSVEPRKACLYYPAARESCGEIIPIEGVFPSDAELFPNALLLEAEDLRDLAPLPPDSSYKGTRGRVAVFAGSIGSSGAAVLSSRSCLAAGAGIVALFASKELFPVVAPMLDAVMVKYEPEDFRSIGGDARYDALLIGSGWGREGNRSSELRSLLETGLPAVLDADAIYLYRDLVASGFRPTSPLILTPHPGEFAALTGAKAHSALASPPATLAKAAKALNAVIILKSHVTWIASPGGEIAVWDGNESGLGTAGSGDVLAGLTAGLLARSAAAIRAAGVPSDAAPRFEAAYAAARAAVIAHGLAGCRARKEKGWFESSAIIDEAAKVMGLRKPNYP
jgi:NAD(P)H-hydrate epimerase